MASTLMISNPVTNSDRLRKKKKKKTQAKDHHDQDHIKWKSETQQQIYSSKLLQALSQVRLSSPPPSLPPPSSSSSSSSSSPSASAPPRGRAVREAADRVLAVSAKGRTRWSRAILTNRLKLKFQKKHKRQRVVATVTGTKRSSSSRKPKVNVLRLKGKGLPAVQRKVRFLGRLVPGCRKEPLPVILEEATDYIAALEMQIRAMTALADRLTGAGSNSAPPS